MSIPFYFSLSQWQRIASIFQRRFIRSVIERTRLKLVTYAETEEVIRQWL